MIRLVGMVVGLSLCITGCQADPKPPNKEIENEKKEVVESSVEHEQKIYFKPLNIPNYVRARMIGVSMPEDGSFGNLCLVNLKYYGFDGKTHDDGELIVNSLVAEDVCNIFEELYEKRFPIEKIRLIDEYGANDLASMEDNNTSAFCYRVIEGSTKLSNHGKGFAIDINPKLNPQVTNGQVYPKSSERYADRDLKEDGMISKGDDCYSAFVSRGWTWGGDWHSTQDYQHFEKVVE